ncbi:phosphatase PAP2 family protein [Lacticaseibacillus paracasei]|uniref:phosphatase PAP2 family protein n=1 Tax=Lacticaseibacillus paracasei TaxID=1597 RepID=UPI000C1B6B5B|nr:phosphatase PAP2 family protein [Lacticaseibacillus paracasei]
MLKRRPEPLYLAAIALFIFITLLTGILNNAGWIHTIDQQVIAAVIQFHPVTFKPLLILITSLGNPVSLVFLTMAFAVVLLLKRYRYAALFAASMGALMSLVNVGIKYWVRRPRPFIADPQIRALVHAVSFPSGHSSGTMIFYGTMILLAWALLKRQSAKWLITCLASSMILLTGYSRIFVRVHYPTDVFAGFSLGFALLMVSWWYFSPYLTNQVAKQSKKQTVKK